MRPFMTAHWINLGIFTYAVPPRVLRRHLPRGLELDLIDGDAFVSLVAFDFRDTRVLGVPWPGYRHFSELNLRCYVRRGEERGVMFLREFVGLRLVSWIARTVFNENYRVAAFGSAVHETADALAMTWNLRLGRRVHHLWMAGEKPAVLPSRRSLEHYFTDLRWAFGADRQGVTIQYEVKHPAWAIYPVRSWSVDLDWAEVYGPEWRFLNGAAPCCTVLAAGSEVLVYPRAERRQHGIAPEIAWPLLENHADSPAQRQPAESSALHPAAPSPGRPSPCRRVLLRAAPDCLLSESTSVSPPKAASRTSG